MEMQIKRKRVSILDYHFEEIKSLREKGVSIMSIYKIINDKLPNKLTYRDWETDRKSTRLNSSHSGESRMPSSA